MQTPHFPFTLFFAPHFLWFHTSLLVIKTRTKTNVSYHAGCFNPEGEDEGGSDSPCLPPQQLTRSYMTLSRTIANQWCLFPGKFTSVASFNVRQASLKTDLDWLCSYSTQYSSVAPVLLLNATLQMQAKSRLIRRGLKQAQTKPALCQRALSAKASTLCRDTPRHALHRQQ